MSTLHRLPLPRPIADLAFCVLQDLPVDERSGVRKLLAEVFAHGYQEGHRDGRLETLSDTLARQRELDARDRERHLQLLHRADAVVDTALKGVVEAPNSAAVGQTNLLAVELRDELLKRLKP